MKKTIGIGVMTRFEVYSSVRFVARVTASLRLRPCFEFGVATRARVVVELGFRIALGLGLRL